MHIGVDLTKEAVWDSFGSFDIFEYLSGACTPCCAVLYDAVLYGAV